MCQFFLSVYHFIFNNRKVKDLDKFTYKILLLVIDAHDEKIYKKAKSFSNHLLKKLKKKEFKNIFKEIIEN